jgi:hypothetical protein
MRKVEPAGGSTTDQRGCRRRIASQGRVRAPDSRTRRWKASHVIQSTEDPQRGRRDPRSARASPVRVGYIKVKDKHRFRPDHHFYVMADENVSVEDGTVRLSKLRDELIKSAN